MNAKRPNFSEATTRRIDRVNLAAEDYRARATLDLEHDRADREAGRWIACPVFVLWGERDFPTSNGSPVAVWRRWATHVQGQSIDCDHFIAEERPDACAV